MKLFVGNLPNNMTEEELTVEFKKFGEIQTLKIITDRDSGKSRGFGFLEMQVDVARKAMQELNDSEIMGRRVTVKEAQEKKQHNRNNY